MDLKGSFKNLFKKVFKKPSFLKLPSVLKKSPKKRTIILLSSVAFILILVAVWMFVFKSDKDKATANKDLEVEKIQINQINYDNIVVLKPFKWIQLKDSSYMQKVSLNIAIELTSKDNVEMVEAKTDNIRTLVRKMIKQMRWIEMRSPEGKIKFKYLLIKKINLLFPDVVVRNLYLTHFIMR